jgi:hypothetical protein
MNFMFLLWATFCALLSSYYCATNWHFSLEVAFQQNSTKAVYDGIVIISHVCVWLKHMVEVVKFHNATPFVSQLLQHLSYGLGDQGIGLRLKVRTRDFSLFHSGWTSPGSHPECRVESHASPGLRQQGCEADHIFAEAVNCGCVVFS